MLDLCSKSWHTRLYIWTQLSWDRFAMKGDTNEFDHATTDLCTYIRALTVKLPILLALYGFMAYYIVYVLFLYPVNAAGTVSYLTFLMWAAISLITVTVLGFLIAGVCRLIGKVEDVRQRRNKEIERGDRSPGLWTLLKRWMRDKHDRICSTVRIIQ